MKLKLFLTLVVAFVFFAAYSQTKKSTTKKRVYHRSATTQKAVDISNSTDSADIYYLMGWDSYKKGEFGDARFFWEKSSGCVSTSASKYSAMFRLGLLNQAGEGVGVNLETAFYYFNQAYNEGKSNGNVDATKNVAAYYENGMAVQRDNKKALEWYLKAKAQGNKYCNEDIARVRAKVKAGDIN
ncbi:tetratricopeptide repeat protein [Parasediminibacterium sp. JCM 36343]|uniref:tetratricopeptide repeat protein n=1 Tax=Parasediminibacterium sp. JCM 36343 TaxID=3374279 RepID=UPI00397D0763